MTKKNPDPEHSARAKAVHAARRQREAENAEKARKYDELMAQQRPQITSGGTNTANSAGVIVTDVTMMPIEDVTVSAPAPGRQPTESAYGGPQAEKVAEAQDDVHATPEVLPIVEVPLGTVASRQPSDKPEDIKEAENIAALAQAQLANREALNPFPEVPSDKEGDVVIHFVKDGFTALGKTFEEGETLALKRGSELWNQTLDRNGRSWTSETEAEQRERREDVYFRPGPHPREGSSAVSYAEEQAAIMSSDPDDLLRLKKRQARAAKPSRPAVSRV
jgi:hypothetical protein